MMDHPVIHIILCIMLSINYLVLNLLTSVQPEPYMDEVFHVPQASKYCEGNYSYWDEKITTPPGLYVFSTIFLQHWNQLLNMNLCTTFSYRFINSLLPCCHFLLIYLIFLQSRISPKNVGLRDALSALNITIFPVSYFFCFLYYTDGLSTLMILLTYYNDIRSRTFWTSFFGLCSVSVRQTNIAWIGLFAMNRMLLRLYNNKHLFVRSELAGRKSSRVGCKEYANLALSFIRDTLPLWPSCLLLASIYYNFGSIVMGDKNAHKPTIHLPQLLYLSAFVIFFSSPLLAVGRVKSFFNFVYKRPLLLFASLAILTLVVRFDTKEHLYLLSDNRHYTFYIWNRIFRKTLFRYLLIPAYIFCIYRIAESLSFTRSDMHFGIAFIICAVVTIGLQELLEFRYFIIPYILYRIRIDRMFGLKELALEFVLYAFINFITFRMFLYSPFYWADGTLQRFIW